MAKVLAHADSHGGARPAGDGVDPSRHAAALCRGSRRRQQRWIGNQRDGVERDADGIEDRSEQRALGIEQKQTGNAERKKRGRQNRRKTFAPQQPCARQRRGKMQQLRSPTDEVTLARCQPSAPACSE